MLSIDNRINSFELNIKVLKEILSYLNITRDIELILCDDDEIKSINKKFRAVDKITDVLSFPFEGDFEAMPLGSIVISINRVKEVSKELGHSYNDEVTLLFIHGLLHLLGFDHEVDNGQMREKEHELIKLFSLPKSLILRSE